MFGVTNVSNRHCSAVGCKKNATYVIAGNSAIDNTADALKYLLIGSPRHNTKPIKQTPYSHPL